MLAYTMTSISGFAAYSQLRVEREKALNLQQMNSRTRDMTTVGSMRTRTISSGTIFSNGENYAANNYSLQRVDSEHTLNSNLSFDTQYRVRLQLNDKEIELLRYTWNRMLNEDYIEEKKPNIPMAGMFPVASKKEKKMKHAANAVLASSLFCTQFYSNLLGMDPKIERLFPLVKHQAVSFAGVMTFAISQLENLSVLDEYLMKLGKRHSRVLNIDPPMFEMMGEAFINTFHERFGIRFTHELEVLWIKLYLYLANSILQYGIDPVMKVDHHKPSISKMSMGSEETYVPHSSASSILSKQQVRLSTTLHSMSKHNTRELSSHVKKKQDPPVKRDESATRMRSPKKAKLMRFLGRGIPQSTVT